jgi:YkoY family integral membrane protein
VVSFLEGSVIVLTLLVLEAVLSFDNAAVLAAMVRKLPLQDRRKALMYGLVGAYVLRILAILAASFLIRTPILKVLGGGYLVFIAVRHFIQLARHKANGGHHIEVKPGLLRRWGVPALWAVVIQVELVDLAFAIDQVIVAVAFTNEIVLIILAAMMGILFLRIAAGFLARIMDWLPLLEHMAYVAVAYVGAKLILLHPFFSPGGECFIPPLSHDRVLPGGVVETVCEIPTLISVGITLSVFAVPVLLKLLFGIPRSRAPEPGS